MKETNYHRNRKRAQTVNTKPTLTEQSAAHETDINVIVGRFLTSGAAPGNTRPPIEGDFSELPGDLRAMLEQSKTMTDLRGRLPPELRDIPVEELLMMTGQEILAKIKPTSKPDDKPKDEPK